MNVLWNSDIKIKKFPKLNTNIETDVLVIGGGICGILCAYELMNKGIKVVVVEKDYIGLGITQNTTATISKIQDIPYYERIEMIGYDKTKLYLKALESAVDRYYKLSQQIDFDYDEKDCIFYDKNNSDLLKKELDALRSLGENCEIVDDNIYNYKFNQGIKISKQGICNPLKLIAQLSSNIEIYEKTNIIKLHKNKAITKEKNTIRFKNAIVCTNYPAFDKGGFYFSKLHQLRSEVVVIKKQYESDAFYIDMNKGGLYIRNYKNYDIIGGFDYRVGECHNSSTQLISEVKETFKEEIIFNFSNQDCISLDQIPYIGKISPFYKNIYVATGFNAYGMTNSMLAAEVICSLILVGSSIYEELLSPNRKKYKKEFFKNMKIFLGSFFNLNGKRCTHLGCKLNYNKQTKCYECLCHGSRYGSNGAVLNGPAKKHI